MEKHYLRELSHHDGEDFIKFNIVEINTDKGEIVIAITKQGKISVNTFDLIKKFDSERLYFEYGVMLEEIYVDDFTQIKEEN